MDEAKAFQAHDTGLCSVKTSRVTGNLEPELPLALGLQPQEPTLL